MYWQKRFHRENPDAELENIMIEIRKNNKDFGYRRIYGELRKHGMLVNKKKVQRIAQKLGLQVTSFTRKSRKYSSYKGKVGRMTIQKLYLDPFMDMFNSEILNYSIDKHPSAQNIMNALNETIEITSDCPYRRIFHSDRGWAYQMKSYSSTLKTNRIYQSMSRKGNCYDNAIMENFFGVMKQEMYYGCVYYSYEGLKDAIEKYIDYYNNQRIKQKLSWMSPVEYRLSQAA